MNDRFVAITDSKENQEAQLAEREVNAMVDRFGRDLLYVVQKYLGANCVNPEATDVDERAVDTALLQLKMRLVDHRVKRVLLEYRRKRLRGEENDSECRKPGVVVFLSLKGVHDFRSRKPVSLCVLDQWEHDELKLFSVRLPSFFYLHRSGSSEILFEDRSPDGVKSFSLPIDGVVCVVGTHYGDFWQNPDPEMVEFTKALDEQQI